MFVPGFLDFEGAATVMITIGPTFHVALDISSLFP